MASINFKQIGLTAAAVALATGSLVGSLTIASGFLNPASGQRFNHQQPAVQLNQLPQQLGQPGQNRPQGQGQGGQQLQSNPGQTQTVPNQNQQLQQQFQQQGQMPNFGNMSNSTQHG